jgi:mono/diheme cytochrome c family protein
MKYLFLVIGISLSTITNAQSGEELFNSSCVACHTIGKGRLVGPDLKNLNSKRDAKWAIEFIRASQSLIKSGNGDAIAIFEEYGKIAMPDNNLADDQILSILSYIEETGSGSSDNSNVAETKMKDILSDVSQENIDSGAKLFSGLTRFSNNGAACSSCHKVLDESSYNSGTLAKDLSETYELMGSAGISGIIKNSPFPVMNKAYQGHSITEEEVIDLTAYLKFVSEQRVYQRPQDIDVAFVGLGSFVFVLIVMSTVFLYLGRKKETVNHKILSRQS